MLSQWMHDLAALLTQLDVPVLEKVLRTVVVYFFVALLLRVFGKRDLGQFSTFDLVVTLLLSNVVQNAIIGPDTSLAGGLLGALTLLATNWLVNRAVARGGRVEVLLSGRPSPVVANGVVDLDALHGLGLSESELDAALRRQGVHDVNDVQAASLLPSGTLDVQLAPRAELVTRADIDRAVGDSTARLLARLDELEGRLAPA